MKQKTPKTKKIRRKISFGGWILLFSLTIVIIAGSAFAWILYGAISEKGHIIVGSRFQMELDPAIEKAKITEVKTAIEANSFAVKTSVNLRSATLRILVQINGELTDAELSAAILKIKDDVNAALPIDTYFTSTPDIKMYDLEIQVYNGTEPVSTETFTYHHFILVKNANMVSWQIQDVSVAVNPEMRAILEERLNSFNTPAQ
jgi:spore coat protein CotF